MPQSIASHFGLLALVCASSLGLPSCSAEADIPEVVVTQPDVMFEGVPEIPGFVTPRELSTEFDHPEGFDLPSAFSPELYPLELVVEGRDAMVDLSFIETLVLTLASRDAQAPAPREMAVYRRGDTTNVGQRVSIPADRDSDVVEYWDTNRAYYQLSVTGDLPSEDWGVDVIVKFRGSLSVSTH